jgi:hypothetical protein
VGQIAIDNEDDVTVTAERTELGREIETALGEVLAHVRGETELPCRIVALRKRFRRSR